MHTILLKLFLGLNILMLSTAWAVDTQPLTQQALQYQQTREANAQFSRKQWDLTKEQWRRYKELMQGIRGSISPRTISPIEVLGTHARTEQERKMYALKWAKMMHDDITQVLAFQSAYTEAWHTLYPNGKLIDINKLNLKANQTQLFQEGDRILAFLNINNCGRCQTTLSRVQNVTRTKNVQLDIYFLDTTEKQDDDKIRLWAKKLPIDKGRIKKGVITLNHDNGTLLTLSGQLPFTNKPLLYRIRNDAVELINL